MLILLLIRLTARRANMCTCVWLASVPGPDNSPAKLAAASRLAAARAQLARAVARRNKHEQDKP